MISIFARGSFTSNTTPSQRTARAPPIVLQKNARWGRSGQIKSLGVVYSVIFELGSVSGSGGGLQLG